MRWKAHFHLNPVATKEEQKPGARRLKSQRTPPSNSGLDQFESDLFGIIRKIEFMNSKNSFQAKLREDIERIRKSRKIWVRSDKSNNIYQVSPHEYERILNDRIIKEKEAKTNSKNIFASFSFSPQVLLDPKGT